MGGVEVDLPGKVRTEEHHFLPPLVSWMAYPLPVDAEEDSYRVTCADDDTGIITVIITI